MREHALGIDVAEHGARAVLMGEGGTIVRRQQTSKRDPTSVASLAADVCGGAPAGSAGVVIAGDTPDAAAIAAAVSPVALMVTPGAAVVAAETWIGAARGARHVVCLWVGDRVFAGILLDGHPWSGAHGLAGAAGWLALNPVERQDYKKFGSLAAEVSNQGIARRLSWRVQAGDDSSVVQRTGDLEAITAADVYEGARSGDGVSISVVRDTARYIGMAAANFAATLDPEIVVLGGAAAVAADLLLDAMRQEALRRLPPAMTEKVRFEVSPLGEDGVAVGAARLAQIAGR